MKIRKTLKKDDLPILLLNATLLIPLPWPPEGKKPSFNINVFSY
jgi:hypothetical protein